MNTNLARSRRGNAFAVPVSMQVCENPRAAALRLWGRALALVLLFCAPAFCTVVFSTPVFSTLVLSIPVYFTVVFLIAVFCACVFYTAIFLAGEYFTCVQMIAFL